MGGDSVKFVKERKLIFYDRVLCFLVPGDNTMPKAVRSQFGHALMCRSASQKDGLPRNFAKAYSAMRLFF